MYACHNKTIIIHRKAGWKSLESNEMKLQEILKARGITDEQLKEVQEQDIPAAAESFQRIMDIYYLLKVTADMESAYWYNRVWWENDGDLL